MRTLTVGCVWSACTSNAFDAATARAKSLLGDNALSGRGVQTKWAPNTDGGSAAGQESLNFEPIVSLSRFQFKPEYTLLEELGLPRNQEYEDAALEAAAWFAKPRGSSARQEISRRCEHIFGDTVEPFKPDTQTLPCVPWALERMAQERDAKRRKGPPAKPSVSLPRVRTEAQWDSLKDLGFMPAFQRVDPPNVGDLVRLKTIAMRSLFDCRYAAATAALIARAEAFLPDQRVFEVVEELYPGAFACLEPDVDGFERTHLRVGLLRLLKGETLKAKQSLLLASRAEEPKEEFRSLFWLGAMAEGEEGLQAQALASTQVQSGVKLPVQPRNEYWGELTRKYPLALHSVLASHSQGIDPAHALVPGDDIFVARRLGREWTEYNMAAFLFELYISRQETQSLSALSQFFARHIEVHDPRATLFMGICHNVAQNHRASIATLSQFMKDTDNKQLSLELLNLYFPRPLSDEILAHVKTVDPVLVFALIRQESAFDPMAKSVADARGLMQVLPSTASKYIRAKSDLYEASTNLTAGVSHIEELLKRYNGKVEHVLAAYNAGGRHLERWKTRFPNVNILLFSDLVPFRETRTYISIILRNAYWYGRMMVIQDDRLARTILEKSKNARWKSTTVSNLLSIAWARKDASKATAAVVNLYNLGQEPGSVGRSPSGTKLKRLPSAGPAQDAYGTENAIPNASNQAFIPGGTSENAVPTKGPKKKSRQIATD